MSCKQSTFIKSLKKISRQSWWLSGLGFSDFGPKGLGFKPYQVPINLYAYFTVLRCGSDSTLNCTTSYEAYRSPTLYME